MGSNPARPHRNRAKSARVRHLPPPQRSQTTFRDSRSGWMSWGRQRRRGCCGWRKEERVRCRSGRCRRRWGCRRGCYRQSCTRRRRRTSWSTGTRRGSSWADRARSCSRHTEALGGASEVVGMGRKRSGMVGRPRRPSGLKWLGGWSGAWSEPRRAGETSRPGRPVSSPQRGPPGGPDH